MKNSLNVIMLDKVTLKHFHHITKHLAQVGTDASVWSSSGAPHLLIGS